MQHETPTRRRVKPTRQTEDISPKSHPKPDVFTAYHRFKRCTHKRVAHLLIANNKIKMILQYLNIEKKATCSSMSLLTQCMLSLISLQWWHITTGCTDNKNSNLWGDNRKQVSHALQLIVLPYYMDYIFCSKHIPSLLELISLGCNHKKSF